MTYDLFSTAGLQGSLRRTSLMIPADVLGGYYRRRRSRLEAPPVRRFLTASADDVGKRHHGGPNWRPNGNRAKPEPSAKPGRDDGEGCRSTALGVSAAPAVRIRPARPPVRRLRPSRRGCRGVRAHP
jgi:hypothetical protein